MKLKCIGCGDAFGSGGRFHTCFHITGNNINFLLDCGASSLIALKSHAIVLNEISSILVTHFHADHFGGIPFFILDAQLFSKRTRPLVLAGPPGLRKHYEHAMEAFFPGSLNNKLRFDLSLVELNSRETTVFGAFNVTPFAVNVSNTANAFFAYRIEAENRILSYTGDTEWSDELIALGDGADLFMAEAYFYDKKVKSHLDYTTLMEHIHLINPKRLVLTHMSDDMLSNTSRVSCEVAQDGKIFEL